MEEQSWQQFLTEKVLKECWHNLEIQDYELCPDVFGICKKCNEVFEIGQENRTFDNWNDLVDLYEKIEKDGKWDEFFWFSASHCKPKREGLGCSETTAWFFCLDQKDYEERCKMVAEFYGWEGNEQY